MGAFRFNLINLPRLSKLVLVQDKKIYQEV